MNPRLLRCLPALAVVGRERHYGRAAKALGLDASAASRQIAQLEALIGFPLFLRTTRRVALSPAGERLWRGTITAFEALDTALAEARELAVGRKGLVRIGYTRAWMARIGAASVRRLRSTHPDVVLDLHEMGTDAQCDALRRGLIDIALLHPPFEAAELRVEDCGSTPLVLAAASTHPRARDRSIHLATLAPEAFILYPRAIGPALYDRVMATCREAGFTPEVVQHCASWEGALDLAATGLGVAWVPRLLAASRSDVRVLRVVNPMPDLPYAAAMRRPSERVVRILAERIVEVARSHSPLPASRRALR